MCSSVHYLIICVSFCWAHPLQFWFWIDVTIPISALCAHDIRFQKRNLVYISCSFATCHAILFRMSVLVRCCCFCFFRASKHIHRILFRVHIHYNWAGLRGCGSDRVCVCMCTKYILNMVPYFVQIIPFYFSTAIHFLTLFRWANQQYLNVVAVVVIRSVVSPIWQCLCGIHLIVLCAVFCSTFTPKDIILILNHLLLEAPRAHAFCLAVGCDTIQT